MTYCAVKSQFINVVNECKLMSYYTNETVIKHAHLGGVAPHVDAVLKSLLTLRL